MQQLTDSAWNELSNIAQRYNVSTDAARTLLDALWSGNGSMAQFNHPELGGYGQWMRGGMIMVGDMFNNGLKNLVDNLCQELNRVLERGNPYLQQAQSQGGGGGGSWWPSELGSPSSSGGQNNVRYAYFAGPRRLAIEQNGVVTVYDTLEHQIGGVSQQQSGGYSVTFSSQLGYVDLAQLPVVSGNHPKPQPPPQQAPAQSYSYSYAHAPEDEADIFAKIEKLAALRQKGVLSDEEFAAKKAELLARI
jgi:hypothetical protein